jgi:isochorismate hydrolase
LPAVRLPGGRTLKAQPLSPRLPTNAALIVIDVQKAFDLPRWGNRNNWGAEANIPRLIAARRSSGRPVIHVHHETAAPESTFRRDNLGIETKSEALPADGEPLYWKSVNSAFIGTTLEANLRRVGMATVVVVGLTTNHCVSTTVRMAGNLGFETFVVSEPPQPSAKPVSMGGSAPPRRCMPPPSAPARGVRDHHRYRRSASRRMSGGAA